MQKKKTRRGTPIRSTLGMRAVNRSRDWILVADRHRLCLFEGGSPLALQTNYVNPEGRKKGRDFVSERPGRSFDSQDRSHHGQTGGSRHAYGNAVLPEDRALETLVRKAVELLKDDRFRDAKTHVTVLAEPRLMGRLRPALAKASQCEIAYCEKDLAWIEGDELEKRLLAEGLG